MDSNWLAISLLWTQYKRLTVFDFAPEGGPGEVGRGGGSDHGLGHYKTGRGYSQLLGHLHVAPLGHHLFQLLHSLFHYV